MFLLFYLCLHHIWRHDVCVCVCFCWRLDEWKWNLTLRLILCTWQPFAAAMLIISNLANKQTRNAQWCNNLSFIRPYLLMNSFFLFQPLYYMVPRGTLCRNNYLGFLILLSTATNTLSIFSCLRLSGVSTAVPQLWLGHKHWPYCALCGLGRAFFPETHLSSTLGRSTQALACQLIRA